MVSCGQKWYLVKVLWTFDFLPTTQRAQETWRCLPERHKNQKKKVQVVLNWKTRACCSMLLIHSTT